MPKVFSPEQADAMKAKAMQLNWVVRREDTAIVEKWCRELRIQFHQFKTWISNNKKKYISVETTGGGAPIGARAAPDLGETSGDCVLCHRRSDAPFEFFKVLVPGRFEETLELPKHLSEHLGGECYLELQMDGQYDGRWPVRVKAHGDDDKFHLKYGWQEFVAARKLKNLDFLTFTYYEGASVLVVKIYTSCGCRRENRIDDNISAGPNNIQI